VLDPSTPAHARADQRLRSEQIIWLTTVRADGQAQSSPVWFLWDGQTFLVYSQPQVPKVRNLAANPKVSLHLGDDGAGDDIVIVEGTATVEPDAPRADHVEGFLAKYRAGTRRWVRNRARSPAPTRPRSGSARPGSGPGSEAWPFRGRAAAGPGGHRRPRTLG
jgi:PPOX class probable F420-dependent enzyme